MGKVKFRRSTVTAREQRRMDERKDAAERKKQALAAFWALPPEERARRVADNEMIQRIQRNGITIEDVHKMEEEAYKKGISEGRDYTIKMAYAALCLTLHDLHGFGKKRCERVLDGVYDRMCYTLTTAEAIQEVYDTMKLELTFSCDLEG